MRWTNTFNMLYSEFSRNWILNRQVAKLLTTFLNYVKLRESLIISFILNILLFLYKNEICMYSCNKMCCLHKSIQCGMINLTCSDNFCDKLSLFLFPYFSLLPFLFPPHISLLFRLAIKIIWVIIKEHPLPPYVYLRYKK